MATQDIFRLGSARAETADFADNKNASFLFSNIRAHPPACNPSADG